METGSESNSIRSVAGTPTSLRSPNTPHPPGWKKQVGFTRPTLIIPPPSARINTPNYSAATTGPRTNNLYERKASEFMFDQFNGIKGFTKSGLGAGERTAYWLYNKLRSWSRKWFTHMFLTIVLIVYTVGGAIIFQMVEGENQKAVEINIRLLREELLINVTKAMEKAKNTSLYEAEGVARRYIKEYEDEVIQAYLAHKLVITGTPWSFKNAIIFCSTVYTSIVKIMDALQAPSENQTEQNVPETSEPEINMTRIEAMVTPEQVFSASVAKKRRTFTKKRNANSNNREREQTPAREIEDKTTTDEEVIEPRPKTPDRKRRKKSKVVSKQNRNSKTETEITDAESDAKIETDGAQINQNKAVEEFKKKDGLADMAQAEVIAFFNRTKKSIAAAASRSRDKFRKIDKEQLKRSRSAPHTFTEEELIESFRKAQLLNVNDENHKNMLRKHSDSSLISLTIAEPFVPKPFRPEVKEFVRQRKKEKGYSNKIIEILDPKTSNVIATKTVIKPNFNFTELISVLRRFTIKELRMNFKIFKTDMKVECERIRKLRNRCMCELFLIMIFCGLGGIMFKLIEGSFEYFYKCGVKRVKRDFIDMLWIKSHNLREDDWKSLARNKLRTFEEELHTAHEAGMKTYSGQRSWSFLNGVVYALTVITTIGYGHIYPETITGKALTIVYAIIGLPLFLIALTDFGKLFTRGIKFLWSFVRRLYYTGSCRRVRKQAQMQELFKGAQMMYEIATLRRPSMFVDPENPNKPPTEDGTPVGEDTPTTPAISNFEIDDEFNLPISLAIFILILYIIIGCCILLLVETEWTFFDAFYFIFISMSTIGFGDIVPDKPFFMIASIVYLVFGLALTSMCINVVQAKLSDTFKQASSKLGATIGFEVEDDGTVVTVPPEPVELPEVHGADQITEDQSPNEGNSAKDKEN